MSRRTIARWIVRHWPVSVVVAYANRLDREDVDAFWAKVEREADEARDAATTAHHQALTNEQVVSTVTDVLAGEQR